MENVSFRHAPAEESGLDTETVDLITVAQALHWFDIERFFAESRRVLKPGGLLAFWCYERNRVDDECDAIISRMFTQVEDYWPPERDIVEKHYRDIESPFEELRVPGFEMSAHWHVEDILGYFRTWSASKRYLKERNADPFAELEPVLRRAWGTQRRSVRWPLTVRLARK